MTDRSTAFAAVDAAARKGDRVMTLSPTLFAAIDPGDLPAGNYSDYLGEGGRAWRVHRFAGTAPGLVVGLLHTGRSVTVRRAA